MRSGLKRGLVGVLTVVGAFFALALIVPWLDRLLFPQAYALIDTVEVGMDEGEVRARLGTTPVREHTDRNADYCVSGYGCNRRKISGKVLIYHISVEHVAYVYFDENGRTEEVFIAGS